MQISYTKKLGQLLIESNLLTEEQLADALKRQKKLPGQKIGQILVNNGYISEGALLKLLEAKLNIALANIPLQVPVEVFQLLSEQTMRRLKAFPIAREGNILTMAMADPLDMLAIDELRQFTGLEIKPLLASVQQIEAAILRHYGILRLEKEIRFDSGSITARPDNIFIEEHSPVIRLVEGIIKQAVLNRSSDIHIEPQENVLLVRERVDGLLRVLMKLSIDSRHTLVSRIKILAQLDIAEKRFPQDGRFIYQHGAHKIDLRVSTMPTIYGEKVVIRLLRKEQELLDINQLGFSAENLTVFNKLVSSSSGMFLITGPTNCGKTTTIYAILNRLNTLEKNIITLEDPVEYTIPGINQMQINTKAGLSFGAGLRAILRQDPDIIMVGEIRDYETAEIATRAASTGHLVLSTMHTGSTADAVTRLLDMGIEPYLVASSVIGVVAQRLVRKICPACKENITTQNGLTHYRSVGCHLCEHTGFSGRTGIHEVMLMTPDLKRLVVEKASSVRIKEQALRNGMIPLKDDGAQKAQAGLTTLQEVMRVTYSAVD